ncbi:hypothetical protein RHSIM_RhsimUnG0222300 [Rhododendron simsii]|uniref:Transmembrane protein n=1 Tax=Rhododendron simsii TaxID=118357 RepID=A0A834FTV6_RHOSS|nr:hypothetical protein RHSIM_RhsimUnG0222300 [Rhododendron simsii]
MSSPLTRKAEEGSGASTGAEGNPEHDSVISAASIELPASVMLRPQRPTTTTDDVSGSSNTSTTSTTSGSAAAPSTSRDREAPPDRNDAAEIPGVGPRGRTDDDEIPRPRGRNDDDKGQFKLGKTFLGLTFQAALALMIYRKQLQQADSSSANPSSLSSILFTSVGATMLFGFAFTMSGMMLQKHHQNVANFCSYVGVFLGTLGFFFMMDIFAGKGLDWLVWAVGGVLLLVFAYTLRRDMQYD